MSKCRNVFVVGALIVNTARAAPSVPGRARHGWAGLGRRAIAELREGLPGNSGDPVLSTCEGSVMGYLANRKASATIVGLRDRGITSADTY